MPDNEKSVIADAFNVIVEVKSLIDDAFFVIADAFHIESNVEAPLR
ncbi:MAG: hypothetical protein ACREO7_07025 [Pseudoxanthomonas sp.]